MHEVPNTFLSSTSRQQTVWVLTVDMVSTVRKLMLHPLLQLCIWTWLNPPNILHLHLHLHLIQQIMPSYWSNHYQSQLCPTHSSHDHCVLFSNWPDTVESQNQAWKDGWTDCDFQQLQSLPAVLISLKGMDAGCMRECWKSNHVMLWHFLVIMLWWLLCRLKITLIEIKKKS